MKKSKRHDTGKKTLMQNETSNDIYDNITFNIIGAGKLGQQLAFTMVKEAGFTLLGIYDLKQTKTRTIAVSHPNAVFAKSISQLPKANLTFITTSDDAISNVVNKLSKTSNSGIAVHFSGVLNSETLLPIKKSGWSIASIHPLRSFAENIILENVFARCYCVLEGDTLPCEFLKATFTHLGAKVVSIPSEKKILYHAAATLGSNALVGLLHIAYQLMGECGFKDDAKEMIESLAATTLSNIKKSPNIAAALTGPLVRGDINTVTEHLNQISDPMVKALYKISSKNLLNLTNLSKDKLALFEELFSLISFI